MNDKGFSLIELILAIAISVIVVTAAYSFVFVGSRQYQTTSGQTSIQQEMTFATNILREAVLDGDAEKAFIHKFNSGEHNGDAMLYLGKGKKVIYYDKSGTSLYIFEAGTEASIDERLYMVDSTTNMANVSDNLISKYISDFDVNYKNTSGDGSDLPTESDYETRVEGYSDKIEFSIKCTMKEKSDSTALTYVIRNDNTLLKKNMQDTEAKIDTAVSNGIKSETSIRKYDSGEHQGDIMVYLGASKKVLYYDKSDRSLYLFDVASGHGIDDAKYKVDESTNKSHVSSNLLSSNITNFDVNFKKRSGDTSDLPLFQDYVDGNAKATGATNLLDFSITYTEKNKVEYTSKQITITN